MIYFIERFVSDFILMVSLIFVWHKLLNRKIDFKNPKLYISLIVMTIISVINCYFNEKFVKICFITITFGFYVKYLFNADIRRCIITPIFYQLIIMISETIYVLAITLLFKLNAEQLLSTYEGTLLSNVIIGILSIIIVNFKFIRSLYSFILKLTQKIKRSQMIFFCIIAIIALSVFPVTIYYKINFVYLLIFYSSMIIVCLYIMINSLKTQNKYNKVSDKYNVAINSLNDYEEMMNKSKITNHENKNLLFTIRAMILNGEKDIPKYIDSIVKERYEDDEKLMFDMSKIPSGGLRATIYSEILKIKEKNIEYTLNIDKNLKTIDLIELDTDAIIDICKIICVFIDNAIEEVNKLKTKTISISLYIEDSKLNIKVANNYKGIIEIEKIKEIGYTTKGKGHGYGLSLVQKLVENSSIFENYTEINKKCFSQVLVIKYKKNK